LFVRLVFHSRQRRAADFPINYPVTFVCHSLWCKNNGMYCTIMLPNSCEAIITG
jgi:hypothetical protein